MVYCYLGLFLPCFACGILHLVYHAIGSWTTFGIRSSVSQGLWFSNSSHMILYIIASCLNVVLLFSLGIFLSDTFHASSVASCPLDDSFLFRPFLVTSFIVFWSFDFTSCFTFLFSLGYTTFNSLSNVVSFLGVTLGIIPSVIPPKLHPWR